MKVPAGRPVLHSPGPRRGGPDRDVARRGAGARVLRMIDSARIEIAGPGDAPAIARMSHELIEYGLPWKWRPRQILERVRNDAATAIVARRDAALAGFAIMDFGSGEAHLELLAVAERCQRRGIGRAMLRWLERAALAAGFPSVRLEVRETNHGARAFYRRLGYRPVGRIPDYYLAREPALRMARALRGTRGAGFGRGWCSKEPAPVSGEEPWPAPRQDRPGARGAAAAPSPVRLRR